MIKWKKEEFGPFWQFWGDYGNREMLKGISSRKYYAGSVLSQNKSGIDRFIEISGYSKRKFLFFYFKAKKISNRLIAVQENKRSWITYLMLFMRYYYTISQAYPFSDWISDSGSIFRNVKQPIRQSDPWIKISMIIDKKIKFINRKFDNY